LAKRSSTGWGQKHTLQYPQVQIFFEQTRKMRRIMSAHLYVSVSFNDATAQSLASTVVVRPNFA
jgi:hypothetical protein